MHADQVDAVAVAACASGMTLADRRVVYEDTGANSRAQLAKQVGAAGRKKGGAQGEKKGAPPDEKVQRRSSARLAAPPGTHTRRRTLSPRG